MIARHASNAARRWVIEEECQLLGFDGAFYARSVNWLAEKVARPDTSYLEVMVAPEDRSSLSGSRALKFLSAAEDSGPAK